MRALTVAFAGLAGLFSAPLAAQDAPASAPAAAAAPTTGAANINITPRRVIFGPNKRTEAVYVFNQGNAAVTVDVALVDNVMLPTGEIVPVARAAEKGPEAEAAAATVKSARPYLLAAPSRLVLGPGQGKTIRVRATQPEGAGGAEYRSHLTVTTVPAADSGLTAEQAAAAQRGELVLRIQSIFGLSIPLIVRDGAASAQATLGPITSSIAKGTPELLVPIRRSGTGSVYGNIEVRSGKNEVVGLVRGLAVYPEVTDRIAGVPLLRALRKGETVTVSYFAEDQKPGTAMASGSFTAF
ncbi:hypothetical protein C0V78_09505 [Novosphingobium sp. TH158]|nr:hypothetical protein C0V78_09505 [Novosphingobium sp. TH158]